jgi:hypothetical protein
MAESAGAPQLPSILALGAFLRQHGSGGQNSHPNQCKYALHGHVSMQLLFQASSVDLSTTLGRKIPVPARNFYAAWFGQSSSYAAADIDFGTTSAGVERHQFQARFSTARNSTTAGIRLTEKLAGTISQKPGAERVTIATAGPFRTAVPWRSCLRNVTRPARILVMSITRSGEQQNRKPN